MTDLSNGIKRGIAFFVMAAALIIFGLPLCAHADAYALLSVPDSIGRGGEFTVEVTFSADGNIGTIHGTLGYSEQDIEFVRSQYASGGGGIVTLTAFPQSPSSELTVTLTFRALRPGSSQITLTNGSVMSPDGIMLGGGISASAAAEVSGVADDSDVSQVADDSSLPDALKATLATLTVSEGQLVPAFSPGIYDYTVTLPHEVDYVGIDAEPLGKYDTIWFEGSEYLADGSTLRTITVTTPDGAVSNVYTVNIIRLSENGSVESETEALTDSTDGSEAETVSLTGSGNEAAIQSAANSVSPRPKGRNTSSEAQEPETMHDKLMPILIAAMAVIVLLAALLAVRIRTRSKNKLK
ncbi:Cadherin-like beta sandwich domain-containing protein [Ruminococcus sp. YE71]|uniref:cadherin-like beta sandwich domain-containing protein n=1 Tax=unclassified Ruminococcus TaxID=2608920 RepID=UPI000886CEFB|nr:MULTISPECIES: cadherin-like beta sandwich domain-containing protein [unclassified Ruminococcus]SDA22659.1 Cadherin-like beta sandwich domain-containing protein [Ruminococcus sp. YE78]SFW38559.1 Cadherin-like beta sandwich domain-containing protein [Ruminococcus sp. YE71]